jgi:tRNA A-37 threonylcarbamoyl transferase component Bud32
MLLFHAVAGETTVSRYEVLAQIATGGMATIYVGRARGSAGISRLVAIKKPHPFVYSDPDLLKHVEEEARTASMIHHANVVSVLDMELHEGKPVLILDYVEGASFAELTHESGAVPVEVFWPLAMRVLLDAAAGLSAAHAQRSGAGEELGLVHRDVTPQNLLIGVDGVTRLTDFGIAKTNDASRERTAGNVLKGKLGYMPPEYVDGYTFTAASDQFSLAVVVWESLARQRLFRGQSEGETLRLVLDAHVPWLAESDARLAPFDPIVQRALARHPADRYPTVDDFASALEEAAEGSVGIASRVAVTSVVKDAFGVRLAQRRAEIEVGAPRARMSDEPPATDRDAVETRPMVVGAVAPTSGVPRSASAHRWLIAGLVALLAGGGAWAFLRGRPPPAAPAPPSPSAETAREEEEPVAPAASEEPKRDTPAHKPVRAHPRRPPAQRAPAASASSPYPVHVEPNPYGH